jgi:hypothetical protein
MAIVAICSVVGVSSASGPRRPLIVNVSPFRVGLMA